MEILLKVYYGKYMENYFKKEMTKHFDIDFTVVFFLIHEWLKISLCLKVVLVPLTSQMVLIIFKHLPYTFLDLKSLL